jgi:hypothetical protein
VPVKSWTGSALSSHAFNLARHFLRPVSVSNAHGEIPLGAKCLLRVLGKDHAIGCEGELAALQAVGPRTLGYALAGVTILECTWSDKENDFINAPPEQMRTLLIGIESWLREAQKAYNAILDENVAQMKARESAS